MFPLTLALPLRAEPLTFALSSENGPRQIRFTSQAPLEVVEGSAESFSGSATLDFDAEPVISEASVYVEVKGMQTGVPLRDTHMKSAEWLDAAAYPNILFTLTSVGLAKKKNKDTWFVNAQGGFSMRGINTTVAVPLTITRKKRGKQEEITVSGRFNVKLSEHGVRGPAGMRMIGARVADVVRVDLKLIGIR